MIHNTSVIDKKAKISKTVKIGPFCYVGPDVELSDNVELISNVHIEGNTKIGKGTKIFPFASIGTQPQDLKFKNEKNSLSIGEENIIREYVTINPGTEGGGSKTIIGNKCLFMISSHVAHDCKIGNNVIIQDGAIIGQDGFGYVFDGKKYIKVPQIGIVKIDDDVEIGSNCAIDRGSLNFTEIKKGVKIDNLVHIAHNVVIGENTVIAGQTGIAGSSIIGKNVLMGGQVGIS